MVLSFEKETEKNLTICTAEKFDEAGEDIYSVTLDYRKFDYYI